MNNNHHSTTTFNIIVTSVVTTVLTLALIASVAWGNRESIARNILRSTANNGSSILVSERESAIVAAVEKAEPAVVSIVVTKDVPIIDRYFPSPFDFFGNLFNPQYREPGMEQRRVGGGSGFFVSSDGLILTNKHVVAEDDVEYTVFTNNGQRRSARVVARDPFIDIAIIKVDGSGFSYLEFDENKLQLGQTVIAIGNALGEFNNTVSVGVVSGLSRSIIAGGGGQIESLDEVIQTDAAINPGNSGGPLLNLEGKVVGVNVAVALGSQNIGFSLPSQGLMQLVESVRTSGRIIRPYLGVRYIEVNEAVQEERDLPVDYGVLVIGGNGERAVITGSPADKAGIRSGDIILAFNGERITPERKLSTFIQRSNIGSIVELRIMRNGVERTIQTTLEEYRER
jgi:serine protease Do